MNIARIREINSTRRRFINILQDKKLLEDTFNIIDSVAVDGESAILDYYKSKGINRKSIIVSKREILKAVGETNNKDIEVFKEIRKRVEQLARRELKLITNEYILNNDRHFKSILYSKPLDVIGLYIPVNLPSSLIYYCTFAKVAGVKKVIVALPPGDDGRINPLLLAAASLLGIDKIIAVGGRRAFPSLAFGLGGEVPNKLFGPCSLYVDHVKQVLNCFYKVPVDLPTGPSELLIFLDDEKYLKQAELDIRAQMEHGEDSICFVVSTRKKLLDTITSGTKDIKEQVVPLFASDNNNVLELINEIAPEILEIFTEKSIQITKGLKNVANVYVNTCSPIGDYCYIGKGCADPTFGMARGVSGITMESFFKSSCINYFKAGNVHIDWVSKIPEIEKFKYHKKAIDNFLNK